MTTPEFLYFVDSKVPQLMSSMFTEHLLTVGDGYNLTSQQTLDLPLVPSAAEAQAQFAQEIAFFGRNQQRYQLGLMTHVIEIDDAIATYAPLLMTRVRTAGVDAVYKRGLDYLRETFTEVQSALAGHRQRLQDFRNTLVLVQASYTLAQQQVADKLTGEGGELAALQGQARDLFTALDAVNQRIAAGATMKAIKDVERGLQAASAIIEIPAIGDMLMNTTFDYINDAIGDGGDPVAESDELLKKYASTLLQLGNDRAQVAALAILAGNGGRFIASIDASESILTDASEAMSRISAPLRDFVLITDPAEVCRQLDAGRTFWADARKQANALLKAAQAQPSTPETKRIA